VRRTVEFIWLEKVEDAMSSGLDPATVAAA
jgi:hypothetical protein